MAEFEIKDGVAIIPEGTTEIGQWFFAQDLSLKSVTIPESVTKIGESAFNNCISLRNVNIPKSLTEIGWSAFSGCTSLESITIPESVTKIENSTFFSCTSLKSIVISKGVKEIGTTAFYGCTSLKSIIIPESVTEIASTAFSGCDSLECVTFLSRTKIRDEVHSWLGKEVFLANPSLKTINVMSNCVDYYKERLPEELHNKIVELEPEKQIQQEVPEIVIHMCLFPIEDVDESELAAAYSIAKAQGFLPPPLMERMLDFTMHMNSFFLTILEN